MLPGQKRCVGRRGVYDGTTGRILIAVSFGCTNDLLFTTKVYSRTHHVLLLLLLGGEERLQPAPRFRLVVGSFLLRLQPRLLLLQQGPHLAGLAREGLLALLLFLQRFLADMQR